MLGEEMKVTRALDDLIKLFRVEKQSQPRHLQLALQLTWFRRV